MSWLRIDDSFVDHPKFDGWTSAQRWRWLELMSWCSRHRTNGRVPSRTPTGERGRRTKELRDKAVESGLLDVVGDELWIHDWALYNGDLAARVAAYCEKYPQATANEVHRFSGGTRATVLQLVREYRSGGSRNGSGRTAQAVDKPHAGMSQSGSISGTGPLPHKERPSVSPSRSSRRRARDEPTTDGLTDISSDIEEQLNELRPPDDDDGGPFE